MIDPLKIIWCCGIYLTATTMFGQPDPTVLSDYDDPKTFEIGGIEVEGNRQSDDKALIAVTGLKIGKSVQIPGMAISKAIRSLWKLKLFTDVEILKEKEVGDVVFLKIRVVEQPRVADIKIEGVKNSLKEDLLAKARRFIRKGSIVTENMSTNAIEAMKAHFVEKGYGDAVVRLEHQSDADKDNHFHLIFHVEQGRKVRVESIDFTGNENVSAKKLRKLLATKTKSRLLAPSKLIPTELEQDRENIVSYYKTLGYLDAAVVKDSLWRSEAGDWKLHLVIREGKVYHFGDISWEGNSLYTDAQLQEALGIEKGDVFNELLLDARLQFSQDGRDISSLYMDHGYLFFRVDPVRQSIRKDTIDMVVKLFEGQQATIGEVKITGNSRTHEEVIRRELRTLPGQKFSRADVIRSQREIMNLGFFNPETLDIRTNVHPENSTVDIEYVVEERNNSQFELSAGWGGTGVGITGTAGVTLNNFSMKKLLEPSKWNPFPMGDGQALSFRVQTNGKAYQSFNLSFTEPWLGGKKPNSLTVGGFYNRYQTTATSAETGVGQFALLGLSASMGKRLTWPDDNFISTTSLNFNQYRLNGWTGGLFHTEDGGAVTDGNFYNLNLSQTIARSTINAPIFPTSGSKISLTLQLTAPYSLFGNDNSESENAADQPKWLEYHKWRFDAEWYTTLVGKLVLKASAKFGYLGAYDQSTGIPPFERFQLGGDGLNNIQGGFTGTDIFALRGYEVEDLENNLVNGNVVATPLFNKLSLELRYPLSLNPNATIYGLAFLEGGNAWRRARDFDPFDLKRSVGMGLRVFLPMFGTLGFDYGIGFDKAGDKTLQNFGKFSIILGFEPK